MDRPTPALPVCTVNLGDDRGIDAYSIHIWRGESPTCDITNDCLEVQGRSLLLRSSSVLLRIKGRSIICFPAVVRRPFFFITSQAGPSITSKARVVFSYLLTGPFAHCNRRGPHTHTRAPDSRVLGSCYRTLDVLSNASAFVCPLPCVVPARHSRHCIFVNFFSTL